MKVTILFEKYKTVLNDNFLGGTEFTFTTLKDDTILSFNSTNVFHTIEPVIVYLKKFKEINQTHKH